MQRFTAQKAEVFEVYSKVSEASKLEDKDATIYKIYKKLNWNHSEIKCEMYEKSRFKTPQMKIENTNTLH